MRLLLTLLLLLLPLVQALAQEADKLAFRFRNDVPVSTATGKLASPWSGGLNTPQFSTIDLNKDGQQDLFIFDRQLKKVFAWLAVQQNGQLKYTYAPDYEVFFPADLEHWVLLRDYNCDGLKDIFTSTPLGIRVFKQEPATGGKLKFTLAEEVLLYNSNNVNIQMNGADIPAITDTDGDGDLDILVSEFSRGNTMEFYRNTQAEQGLACGSLKFVQQTNWWGRITECEGCNNYLFSAHCRVAAPQHTGHDGSSLLLIDVDADGDKDLISGAVQCESLVLMENKGNSGDALMTGFTPAFPAARPATFRVYPAAYYEDVTFDGVPDLLVAPQATQDLHDINFQNSTWLYRNTGAVDKPNFNFVQNDFLQGQMIDLSEGAYPAFGDLDADGDLDLLVGNAVSFSGNLYSASISFYRNTGTVTAPAYELVTDDYLGLKNRQLFSIKPAFADINGNGLTDMVLTYKEKSAGTNRVSYIPNKSAKGQAAKYDFANVQIVQNLPDGASPAFADVDNDSDLDMLVGMPDGSMSFYRNSGSISTPNYVLENSSLGGLGFNPAGRMLHPTVADVNGDGRPDLLTVDNSGIMRIYLNFTQQLNGVFTAETQLIENDLTQELQASRFGKGASIAVAPLGGEDKLFTAIGSLGGGVYLLEQTSGNMAVPSDPEAGLRLEVYPNPVAKTERGTVSVLAQEPVQLNVYDVIGRQVAKIGTYSRSHSVSLRNLESGVYIIRATTQTGAKASAKLVVY
ncbi:T9SS type A sorting domain-containing protein [Pontibacter locisalis]|uniref:T9SS type A sorting domain-containing protein n=1 Tax=Pontibacter locisalis TaxID=1719035 RepID=A0ABW5IM19_9BACT